MKTAVSMARECCANYQSENCIGLESLVSVDWILENKVFDTRCLLLRPGPAERTGQESITCRSRADAVAVIDLLPRAGLGFHLCKYFEDAVLPLAKGDLQWEDAASEYNVELAAQGKDSITILSDRVCRCGASLLSRQRLCVKCKKTNAKEAKKKWWNGKKADKALALDS